MSAVWSSIHATVLRAVRRVVLAVQGAARGWSARAGSRPGFSRPAASLLAIGLSLVLTVGGPAAAGSLSGSYVEDTVSVADSLLATIALEQDDPARPEAETEARALINEYISLYRPRRQVNGLGSFTTMQTALNSLAGHYTNYANRPLPEALRTRLRKELSKAEATVVRGA